MISHTAHTISLIHTHTHTHHTHTHTPNPTTRRPYQHLLGTIPARLRSGGIWWYELNFIFAFLCPFFFFQLFCFWECSLLKIAWDTMISPLHVCIALLLHLGNGEWIVFHQLPLSRTILRLRVQLYSSPRHLWLPPLPSNKNTELHFVIEFQMTRLMPPYAPKMDAHRWSENNRGSFLLRWRCF